jgi:predicted transposase/invertase (TIGR01784 family)
MFDKWMFVLRNLSRLLERPKALQDRIFQKLFEQAEIAKYSEAERRQYEASQKEYWDYTSTLETAERKGIQKEKLETVHRMNIKGYSVEEISEIAGLSIDEIKKILQ